MAFDENLAERIRTTLARKKGIEEKKMFGGIGFMLNGNMLVGVWKDSLIVRLGEDQGEAALAGTSRQAVRHHRQADEELGDGQARRNRG